MSRMWSYAKAESRNAESIKAMKRRTMFKLLLFLLAGAIINVAVAWGFSAFAARPPAPQMARMGPIETHKLQIRMSKLGLLPGYEDEGYLFTNNSHQVYVKCVHLRRLNQFAMVENRASLNAPSVIAHEAWLIEVGWPLTSVSGARWRELVSWNLQPMSAWNYSEGIPVPEKICSRIGITEAWLPYGIVWMPFAINTIFYAAVLWVLFAVPVKVRRWRRIKRGQCASCGYSLRGRENTSDKCSECGATT